MYLLLIGAFFAHHPAMWQVSKEELVPKHTIIHFFRIYIDSCSQYQTGGLVFGEEFWVLERFGHESEEDYMRWTFIR